MIGRILTFSVEQRWLVLLLTIAAAGFGVYSLQKLPIDAVPDITNNQVQINTVAPSLSPFDVEKQITYPVETALAGTPGLEYTRSLSRNGFSQVTAVFSEKTDVYFARQQVIERLGEAKESMPPGVDPKLGPISTGLGEIYMWSVSFAPPDPALVKAGEPGWQPDGNYLTPEGQTLDTDFAKASYLRTVQDWIIKPQLKSVPGIAGIDSIGGYVKQYHVQPNPAKLVGLGISFNDIAEALEQGNINRGAGYLERNGEGFVVRSAGRLESMEDISAVVVTTREGLPIRVRDIAEVSIGRELRTGSASTEGREAVVGTALMLIGGNGRTVSGAVDTKLKEISKSLPPSIEVKAVLNRTVLVDATIKTVSKNLAEGALLVILVLFLFLGNFRAALITAMVIPIAMLLTMTGMVENQISANLMSLGALDFGLIVDGAVIITENSLRLLAEKQHKMGRILTKRERLDTVIVSAKEMIQPTIYGQAIIILVYVPLLTFTGVEGKMFEPMALTVIIALAAAFVLSLTFIPAMIALVVTGKVSEEENLIVRTLRRIYSPALHAAIDKPMTFIAGALILFVGAVLLFGRLGQEFIPTLDEKNIALHSLRIPSTALTQSQGMQFQVEQTVSKIPEVAFMFSKSGTAEVSSDPMPPNVSDGFVILKPRYEWPDPYLPKEELVDRITSALKQLPGNNYEFTQPIQMRFNELLAGTRGDIAIKVFGDDFDVMLRSANQIAGVMRSVDGAVDVKVEQVSGLPFLDITVNKEEIARLGISLATVQDVLGASIGGREAGVLFEGDRRFDIIVRLPESVRSDLQALENLPVPLPMQKEGSISSVPLKRVANFQFSEGPNQVSRENGKRRIIVQANVRGRDIGSVVTEAQSLIADKIKLPPGYWVSWGGQFENLLAARQRLMIVVPACFALIFLLLFSALGSVRDAGIVFSAIPLALTGGIIALWLRDMPFSVSAAVGFIALSGVAVLNGLVMLSYIKQLISEGVEAQRAIVQGALTRLRPVAMTALVASLGFVPMAIATGTGAEVQKPLATVVIGGLITATLLTLLVLPALYSRFGTTMARRDDDAAAPVGLAVHPAE
ncbi:MAG: CusA/CzcA family heavy metal efflux RND transporter [Hyphomicrobiales bacterium]|nr:CusA/CzcA family heavy metal efflux RND transporter [Hyphomicrobiales bacterium]